jgi:peptide/nickel transport system ATP-binding protein
MALLEVTDLDVSFRTRDGVVRAVSGASYDVAPGGSLGLVGESGCGKSVSALTVMGLTRLPNATVSGSVVFDGIDLLALPIDELRRIRGRRIAMIFQDPLSSLHPLYKVGWQIVEAIREHEHVTRHAARVRTLELLQQVGIPSPKERLDAYPHELSGGMRQRVMIAMALALKPDLLIADEPSTALDVTVQAQILELIRALRSDFGTALLLITHDLGVVAENVDDVAVMYAGRILERAPIREILEQPQHPYTWGLLQSIPRLDAPRRERLTPIAGLPPSLLAPPPGCPFHPRCPYAFASCGTDVPDLRAANGHRVACHLPSSERRSRWLAVEAANPALAS